MATLSRTAQIKRVIKVLRKHYKPALPEKDRPLLDHLLLACLLEDSPHDVAEEVFTSLQRNYFDWNEVRVSTIRELTEAIGRLEKPDEAAERLKQSLHSVFESVYQFDIEGLRKQNIGQAVKHLQKYKGTSPFVVAYVTQMGLGGHAIPVNRGALVAMHTLGVISDKEFAQGVVPGLERAVSKAKGVEVGSLLHQMGVDIGRNPYGQAARKLLLEISPGCKDRLPKRPSTASPTDAPAEETAATETPPPEAPPKKPSRQRRAESAPAAEKPKKKPPTKQPKATKKPAKTSKASTRRPTKATAGSRIRKRKPR